MGFRALGVSVGLAFVGALAVPSCIRSIVPNHAPPLTEPHVSVSEAFCVVSKNKTQAVIKNHAREVLFELKEGVRDGAVLSGEALDGESGGPGGTFSVTFDEENRPLKCTRDDDTYAIVYYGGHSFSK